MFQPINVSDKLATIGRHMPRERRQNGWVEKTGKKTKSWTGFWYVYVKEDGVEKRRPRSKVLGKCATMTKGKAEDALRDEIREGRPPDAKATFKELSDWYLKTLKGTASKGWHSALSSIFTNQINPRLGDRIAATIKRSEVQQAINEIAADPKSQSKSSITKCLTYIRAVFDAAVDDDLLDHNPAPKGKIVMPPMRPPSGRFLELEECQLLLSVAGRRDSLILQLFALIGFRPGELFALRLNDLTPGLLRVDQTVVESKIKDGAKTEGSKRSLPVPAELEEELRDYIRDEKITDLLFPSTTNTPIAPHNYLDRVLKQLGVLAGIDVQKKMRKVARGKDQGQLREVVTSGLTHQALRRTTATHFQKHGQIKDTQALMGHADAGTTLRSYQKLMEKSLVGGVNSWYSELVPKKPAASETEPVASKEEEVAS
jgi:integrase